MDLEDQYGMADLRQLMNGRSHFPTIPQPPELFSGHRNLTTGQPYDMLMMGRHEIITSGLHDFGSDSAATSTNPCLNSGLEAETVGNCLGGDGGTGRWPRQETLNLLEIRSRLDSKFKEANQKGPLWDEVSRIMCDEHGYQRSGKKCREKFENLYKYYKKTKEGKAGRQDGKHYRFFLQLEALYGETSNNQISIPESHFIGNNNLQFHSADNTAPLTRENYQEGYNQSQKQRCDSLSLSQYSSGFDWSSNSDDNDLSTASGLILDNNDSSEKKKKRRSGKSSSWKLKIKEFIDSHMKNLMERQEACLEKVMKTLEQKERERSLKEEEWRRQETSRIDREHKFWAKERAWIKARDSALVDALQKLTGNEIKLTSLSEGLDDHNEGELKSWSESEISKLIQLRANMESKFSDEVAMWEDIAAKMVSFGYDRSALMLKEKWESINGYIIRKPNELLYSKKRKDNSRGCSINYNFQINHDQSSSIYNNLNGANYSYDINEQVGSAGIGRLQSSDVSSTCDHHHNPNVSTNAIHDACLPFLMGTEGDHNLWDNYGSLKLNKEGQN